MTDIRELLTSERPVAVFPDPKTAERLRKAREFWDASVTHNRDGEPDLSALSDAEIADQIAEMDVGSTEMPDHIRTLVEPHRLGFSLPHKLAIAASLVGAIAIGSLVVANFGGNPVDPGNDLVVTRDSQPRNVPNLDPYLLQQPSQKLELAPPDEPSSDIRAVGALGIHNRSDLSRGELREIQALLNRFDYGPVAQYGLPSAETDAAIARLRRDHGLEQGGADYKVLTLLRELAREMALEDLRTRTRQNEMLEGD